MTSSIPLSCPNSMASLANLWPAGNCTGALLLHVAFFFLVWAPRPPKRRFFFSFFGRGPETPLYIYKQNFLNGKASVIIYFVFSRYYKLARRSYDILSPSLVI